MGNAFPIHRFVDAGEEPTQTLVPIEGYEKKQLVSLAEAVEPLKEVLYNLDTMVHTAMRNSDEPFDGLNIDESAAVHLYTMQWPSTYISLYELLNRTLRTEKRDELKRWFFYLKLILTALYKLPPLKKTIWRAIRGNVDNQYKRDKIWWGFSSCTEIQEVTEQLVGNSGVRTLFKIECISGRSIRSHSYFKNENEILLMPGTYLRVLKKCTEADGLHIIELQEAEPPYQLIASPFSDQAVASLPNIPHDAKWTQNGVTVSGGHASGSALNQLNWPNGLFVDDNQTVYVADTYNHRVVEWKLGAASGKVVAGGNGPGNGNNQFIYPTRVIVDKEPDNIIIGDRQNRRVMRSSRRTETNGQPVIENINCEGLTMDDQKFLYVCDWLKHEVRRYQVAEANGTVVAGGNGKGNRLNQLSYPTYVFVDRNQSVYVSDRDNHRVVKWAKDAREGIVVAGGQANGSNRTQLFNPEGLFVDQLGTVYVADSENHRVMRWCSGKTQGDIVIGGNGEGEHANQLNQPTGLTFDRNGNLYVTDRNNHRVQRFLLY